MQSVETALWSYMKCGQGHFNFPPVKHYPFPSNQTQNDTPAIGVAIVNVRIPYSLAVRNLAARASRLEQIVHQG